MAVATEFHLLCHGSLEKAKSAEHRWKLDKLIPPRCKIVEWRSKPVWIVRRTPEMLDGLDSLDSKLADPKSARKEFQLRLCEKYS